MVPRMPTALEKSMKGSHVKPVRMSKVAADRLIAETAAIEDIYPDGAYLFFTAVPSAGRSAVLCECVVYGMHVH